MISPKVKPKRVFIITPNLMSTVGHEFEYTRSVAKAFRQREYEVKILGGVHAEPKVTELEGFESVFHPTRKRWGTVVWPWEVLSQGMSFSSELQRVLLQISFNIDDLLFVPTIPPRDFIGWVWIIRRYQEKFGKLVLLFRYSLKVSPHSRYSKFRRLLLPIVYKLLFWVISRQKHKPIFVTDSEELASEYRAYTRLPFGIVPIPLDRDEMKNIFKSQDENIPRNNTTKIVYLGDVRRSKGFDLIPPMIEDILNQGLEDIQFVIHCGRPVDGYFEDGIMDSYLWLKRLAEESAVEIIAKILTLHDYYGLLLEADIVMLPYRRENYLGQTSNVLLEAFVAGKPVIAPKDTWVGNQIESTGAGFLFESGDLSSLVEATINAFENLAIYTSAANKIKEQWAEFHNANRLVDELIRI